MTTANVEGTTTNTYAGWTETVVDPIGETHSYYNDAFSDLTEVDEDDNSATSTTLYSYDALGNLTNFTDALGNMRNFTYDGLSRRLTAQDLHATSSSAFGTWFYAYDDAGNLASTTDPKSQNVVYTYDALNRPTEEDYLGASTTVEYTYDSCPDGVGLLCVASTTAEKTSYAYNPLGLQKIATTTIGGINYVTQYGYTMRGDQQTITNPDNSQIKNFFDAGGNIDAIQEEESSGSFANIISDITYAPNDLPSMIWYANGATTTNTYDLNALYRLVDKVTTAPPFITEDASSSIIEFDNSTEAGTDGADATSLTFSHTINSSDNNLLIVAIQLDSDIAYSVTGVTYDGIPLTDSGWRGINSGHRQHCYLVSDRTPVGQPQRCHFCLNRRHQSGDSRELHRRESEQFP